jgi:hypothetical protein
MPLNANRSGQTHALTVLTPVAAGHEERLRAHLEALPQDESPLASLPRTHFARWVIVGQFVREPGQRHEDRLHCPYLLFTSNFDGALNSYLDELSERMGAEALQIWAHCAGCPEDVAGLKAYLLHNQVDTGIFIAAYPHATVPRVRRALEMRRRTIAFAVRSQGLPPAELRQAFVEEFGGA